MAVGSRSPLDISCRVTELARLGIGEGDAEPGRQLLGEDPASDREHTGALDAAVANQGDVGGAAADVDEDAAEVVDLVGCGTAGHGVRLGDSGNQLQV